MITGVQGSFHLPYSHLILDSPQRERERKKQHANWLASSISDFRTQNAKQHQLSTKPRLERCKKKRKQPATRLKAPASGIQRAMAWCSGAHRLPQPSSYMCTYVVHPPAQQPRPLRKTKSRIYTSVLSTRLCTRRDCSNAGEIWLPISGLPGPAGHSKQWHHAGGLPAADKRLRPNSKPRGPVMTN